MTESFSWVWSSPQFCSWVCWSVLEPSCTNQWMMHNPQRTTNGRSSALDGTLFLKISCHKIASNYLLKKYSCFCYHLDIRNWISELAQGSDENIRGTFDIEIQHLHSIHHPEYLVGRKVFHKIIKIYSEYTFARKCTLDNWRVDWIIQT